MSSINKSGKRFIPKMAGRGRRAATATPSAAVSVTRPVLTPIATPVSTQTSTQATEVENLLESQTPLNTQEAQDASVNSKPLPTPLSTQHSIPIVPEEENEEENEEPLSDVDELKEDCNSIDAGSSGSKVAPALNQVARKTSINVCGEERKPSATSSGLNFTQPKPHRTRLNSLSQPSPIPGVNNTRRPSATTVSGLENGSRRGSQVIPMIPVSRRGSVNISRRSSVGTVGAVGILVGENGRRGSVVGENIRNESSVSVSIPVFKSKKRRVSVRQERGGDWNGVTEKLFGKKESPMDKQVVGDVREHGMDGMDEDAEGATERAQEVKKDREEEVGKLEITDEDEKLGKKLIYNNETKKYEAVDVEELRNYIAGENLPIKYKFSHSVESARELRDIRVKAEGKLSKNLKINERKILMGELCKPFLPIGETSDNYERALEAEAKMMKTRVERRKIREKARQLRMSEEEVVKLSENYNLQVMEINESERRAKVKELMDKENEDTRRHNVPVLTMEGGKVTYSHESTVVDRHEDTKVEMERVEENPFENIVTSSSYTKRRTTMKWTAQEVAELLRGVSLWGTDFGLIAQLFPHRTRKQVKARFLLEEKQRPHLVEFALLRKAPVDVDEYSGKSGVKFKDLSEYKREFEELKEKHEQEILKMGEARERAIAEDRAGGGGGVVIPKKRSRKAVLAEFRKNEEVVGVLEK